MTGAEIINMPEPSPTGRVTLPGGGWAEFRDPASLRNKDRKKLLRDIDGNSSDMERGIAVLDGILVTLITDWSLDLPVPSEDPGSLDELTCADFDALTEAADEARKVLFPDFNANPDPKSPTPPSAG